MSNHVFSVHSLSRDSLSKNDCFAAGKMLNFKQVRGSHLLVDGQKVDVGLLHRQQKDKGIALIANTCCAPTAMHKGTETKPHKKKKTAENTGNKNIPTNIVSISKPSFVPEFPPWSKTNQSVTQTDMFFHWPQTNTAVHCDLIPRNTCPNVDILVAKNSHKQIHYFSH